MLHTVRTLILPPFAILPSRSLLSRIHLAPWSPIRTLRSLSSSHTLTATATISRAMVSTPAASAAAARLAALMRSSPSRRLTAVGREVRRKAVAAMMWASSAEGEASEVRGKCLVGAGGERRTESSSAAIPSDASDAMAGAPRICRQA